MIPSADASALARFCSLLCVFLLTLSSYRPPLPVAAPILARRLGPSEERDSIVAQEARRAGMPVALAISISHVENWSGDSTARHPSSGATGLMQVMPRYWNDSFPVQCGTAPLTNRRRNACVGVQIALRYYRDLGNWEDALRAYVGGICRDTDTPARCQRKTATADGYLFAVLHSIYRTDISPWRDDQTLARATTP